MSVPARPHLLVSLHDCSPLTLADCREVVELARTAGIPARALTVLVVPFHEQRVSLADDGATRAFLAELAEGGATLVAHGYTHRMAPPARVRTPWRWFATRVFARDQGELALCDHDEADRRLAEAEAIFARAALATTGFVPPAWLLSTGAADAVAARGFAFVERMGGLAVPGAPRPLARRLIGWGSLTWVEAIATSAYAWLQARRPVADTRVAIHPPDVRRAATRRSLARTLARLAARLEPVSYATHVATRAPRAPAPAPSAPS